MIKNSYFHRVRELTPTRFWINNPTRDQATKAIIEGATGATLNPSYSQKMLDHPSESEYAKKLLQDAVKESKNKYHAAEIFQRKLVLPICESFLPMHNQDPCMGYVSIQADPRDEKDSGNILRQARENRQVAKNICCKIPATRAGITVMETLFSENTTVNATEIFGISQMIAVCESYTKITNKTRKYPILYISHIAGIYDDYLQAYVAKEKISISKDILYQAGLAVARKTYDIMIQRGYNAVFVGGGARGTQHFTEMVGGKVCITINFEGMADTLIHNDPPVIERLFNPVPKRVIDELSEKLPDFKKGYDEEGLSIEEFETFGPVELFRSSFIKSWNRVLELAGTTV